MVAGELSIFYGKRRVGVLTFDPKRSSFTLVYDAVWLKSGFALSPHLPLFQDHEENAATHFLENLLPEGTGLKELASVLKTTSTNLFALVAGIGKDATGAFTLAPSNEPVATAFREIPVTELKARIRDRSQRSIVLWDDKPRLSLAGVQEKIALTIREGKYGFGEGSLASTHILKFGNKRTPHLVLNEFFCMRLLEKTSLPVARVELLNLSERVLQVERFDRHWIAPDKVKKMHLIDGCQMLNIPPAFKYEKFYGKGVSTDDIRGPANLQNIYSLAQDCRVPARAQLTTLHWLISNLIVGNCDHHAKNISYFVNSSGTRVAPAYDILNVKMYPEFDQELAFEVGYF